MPLSVQDCSDQNHKITAGIVKIPGGKGGCLAKLHIPPQNLAEANDVQNGLAAAG